MARVENVSRDRLRALTMELMLIPALSGHEGRVRRRLAAEMAGLGLATTTDRVGNLIATTQGDPARPSVMLFAHMDQLGFVVRKIEASGFLRLRASRRRPRTGAGRTGASHLRWRGERHPRGHPATRATTQQALRKSIAPVIVGRIFESPGWIRFPRGELDAA